MEEVMTLSSFYFKNTALSNQNDTSRKIVENLVALIRDGGMLA
jgi:hypothetical protein